MLLKVKFLKQAYFGGNSDLFDLAVNGFYWVFNIVILYIIVKELYANE